MGKKTINEIKALLHNHVLSIEEVEELRMDERKGVKQLIQQYERQEQEKLFQQEKYQQMLEFENIQYSLGHQFVAGVDEAGRGPLAGPVVAGAVILEKDFYLPGLNDSKQLNEKKREAFYEIITTNAVSFGVGIVDNKLIDEINIYEATKQAMKNAIAQLNPTPEHVLIDAVSLDISISSEALIKGDQRSVSIAAASILAKVTRDRLMREMHKEFPMYQFDKNMGYGTKDHMAALDTYGPSPYHRYSFAPVKEVAKV